MTARKARSKFAEEMAKLLACARRLRALVEDRGPNSSSRIAIGPGPG